MAPPRSPVTVKVEDHRAVVRGSAGLAPALGVFFLAVNGILVFGLSGGFVNLAEVRGWELAAAWVVAGAGMLAGLWILHASRSHRTVLDASRRTVVIERRAPFHTARERLRLGEVRSAAVTTERDSDGDPVYGVALDLDSGRRAMLTPQLYPQREGCADAAEAVNRFLDAHR